jgi:two-component sensor histidine kinase
MDTIYTNCLVKSIYHHSEEIIWFATTKGLAKYAMKSHKFQWFTEQQGLANNLVYTIVPDDDKNLWLSTNGGISRFDLATHKFYNYIISEGLQGSEFNSNSSCKTSDGTIYFGGVNGFNYFNPSEVNEQPFNSPVHITEIKINNKRVSLVKMRKGENYSLSYKQNNIAVSFAAIDFNNAAKISYEYQLRNSHDWIAIGKDRSLTFPQLPAGDYQLNVRARLSDGTISNHIGSLRFIILPPWYNTTWFYAICGISLLGFLYFLYRYRLNQVIKFYHFRTKISQDLHDEVGSTLTSISILSKVSQSNLEKDKSKSAALLNKISEQAADMQQSMSDIVWSIRPDNDKMEDLTIRMREYLGQTAEARDFKTEFFADEEILKESLSMEQRQHLLLIFKEAVNNAVKYSNGNKVSVVIEKVNRRLKLKIQDDGVGFNIETIRSSNGLKNMRYRAKQLNGNLQINSSANGGTVVEFTCNTTL